MTDRRTQRAILLCLAALVFFTWLDLWTKSLAVDALSCAPDGNVTCRALRGMARGRAEPFVVIDDYLELRYAENRGAAFGMLHDAPDWVRALIFSGAALVATGVLMWMFIQGSGGVLFAMSVPLVVSGAIGNMIDRWRLGYVVDFIRVHVGNSWEWPTFNIADSTITVGVALLLLDGMRAPSPTPVRAGGEAGKTSTGGGSGEQEAADPAG